MVTVTKDTIVGDLLDIDQTLAPIFLSIGMHCLGCPASRAESLEEACMVHGLPVDGVVDAINKKIAESK